MPIIAGIDFKGKIGIRGGIGMSYTATLDHSIVTLSARPTTELTGYAEAGVEFFDVLGAGVGGNLTFIKGYLHLNSVAGIWTQTASQVVGFDNFYFGHNLEMLKGNLYAYVELCAPILGCWRPVEHNFFEWSGFTSSGTIAEATNIYVLKPQANGGLVNSMD